MILEHTLTNCFQKVGHKHVTSVIFAPHLVSAKTNMHCILTGNMLTKVSLQTGQRKYRKADNISCILIPYSPTGWGCSNGRYSCLKSFTKSKRKHHSSWIHPSGFVQLWNNDLKRTFIYVNGLGCGLLFIARKGLEHVVLFALHSTKKLDQWLE